MGMLFQVPALDQPGSLPEGEQQGQWCGDLVLCSPTPAAAKWSDGYGKGSCPDVYFAWYAPLQSKFW